MIDTLKRLKRDTATSENTVEAQIAEALAAADAAVPEYRQLIERLERDLRPREAGLEQRRGDLVVGLSRQAAAADLDARRVSSSRTTSYRAQTGTATPR